MNCFTCGRTMELPTKTNPHPRHPPVTTYSAYGLGCEPVAPYWYVGLMGQKCQCASCRLIFTTPHSFEIHQTLRDGVLYCRDPASLHDTKGRCRLVLTARGWGKNPELTNFPVMESDA